MEHYIVRAENGDDLCRGVAHADIDQVAQSLANQTGRMVCVYGYDDNWDDCWNVYPEITIGDRDSEEVRRADYLLDQAKDDRLR